MDWLTKIKEKDEVTYSHSLNVSRLCYEFSLFLGKSKEFAEEMKIAGLLHDIGKLEIPDEVLNKPGKLTDKEYEIMKSHTICSSSYLKEATDIVRNVAWGHHLSFNGNGYPDKSLSGLNIPEECRIAAICDVFEALTAKRQYKEPMTSNEALNLMTNFNQLDPYLFERFKKMMEGK